MINGKIKNIEKSLYDFEKESDFKLSINQRVDKIKAFLENDITDKNCITPEIMEDLIDEITIYPNRQIDMVVNGQKFPCVSAVRQDRHTDRNSGGVVRRHKI